MLSGASVRLTPLAFPSGTVPLSSVPMKFPCTRFPDAPLCQMKTPSPLLPEITFRASAVVPPTVFPGVLMIATPCAWFPSATVPLTSVPM